MNKDLFNGVFKWNPYVPNDNRGYQLYTPNCGNAGNGGVQPYVYTSWREEQLSWYENCYLHAGLNPLNTYWFKGPDAMKFLSEYCVNNFEKFPVGKSKHAIMVNEEGLMMVDGMLLRLAEDEFVTFSMYSYIEYAIKKSGYNIEGKNITGEVFLLQLGGPKSLEVVEAVTGENFHDLPFLGHRKSKIDGRDVRILRVGMAGSLAYEVHGKFEDSVYVYQRLVDEGQKYNIHKLGQQAYWNTHTENGFPQSLIHFYYATEIDKDYFDYQTKTGQNFRCGSVAKLTGSYSKDYRDRYFNPYELGWGHIVNFNHDFLGKEALEKISKSPHREMVTLEWNHEDILDVERSQFEDKTPYFPIEGPVDIPQNGEFEYRGDQVLADGKCVGISTGRCFSWYYRKMLSLAVIKPEYATIGTEVKILWGDEDTRQKEIRATVARFPYMDLERNENIDTSNIPSGIQSK
ncbi:MAG: glycine cleavage T C-terminal barrel domain-containing protein [Coriobacteriales bacterium]